MLEVDTLIEMMERNDDCLSRKLNKNPFSSPKKINVSRRSETSILERKSYQNPLSKTKEKIIMYPTRTKRPRSKIGNLTERLASKKI